MILLFIVSAAFIPLSAGPAAPIPAAWSMPGLQSGRGVLAGAGYSITGVARARRA